MFVAFSSLFLFHVLPVCLHVASLQIWRCRLQQRGIGAQHSACGDRFHRAPSRMQLHFKARKKRGVDVACHLDAQMLELARVGNEQHWGAAAPDFFYFPLSQETSKDVSIKKKKAPILMMHY